MRWDFLLILTNWHWTLLAIRQFWLLGLINNTFFSRAGQDIGENSLLDITDSVDGKVKN